MVQMMGWANLWAELNGAAEGHRLVGCACGWENGADRLFWADDKDKDKDQGQSES